MLDLHLIEDNSLLEQLSGCSHLPLHEQLLEQLGTQAHLRPPSELLELSHELRKHLSRGGLPLNMALAYHLLSVLGQPAQ